MPSFDNPFRRLRERLRLTRLEFADAMGINSATLGLIERGLINNPKTAIAALEAAGYCTDSILWEYQEWLAERRAGAATKIHPSRLRRGGDA